MLFVANLFMISTQKERKKLVKGNFRVSKGEVKKLFCK